MKEVIPRCVIDLFDRVSKRKVVGSRGNNTVVAVLKAMGANVAAAVESAEESTPGHYAWPAKPAHPASERGSIDAVGFFSSAAEPRREA